MGFEPTPPKTSRELVYWPGMSSEIRQFVETCDACASYCAKQSPETLHLSPVPSRPFEKVGTDLFSVREKNYLITVDYYSHFFEIDYLPDISATTVITKLKHHFARHGIPDVVVSDCGTQFTSDIFRKFSREWHFAHEKSSPGNSKANGAAEATVKIAKNLMIKCAKAREDPYIGLLNLRNTPTEGLRTSPAQMIFGRRTKTLIPTNSNRLISTTSHGSDYRDRREKRRMIKANSLNVRRKDLKSLDIGDVVRMQPIQRGHKEWQEATVSERVKNRSYIVETDTGRSYRRNRQFLRRSRKSRNDENYDSNIVVPSTNLQTISPTRTADVPVTPIENTMPRDSPVKTTNDGPVTDVYTTRSGRTVKPVIRLGY